MFSIEVTSPKGQKEKVDCAIDACSIGKGDENLVVVRGWSVAKKHATIRQRPDGFYVEDHGAIGGTEVNGKNIDGLHGPLKSGDVILIGGYSISIDQTSTAAAAPPAAPEVRTPPVQAAAKAAPAAAAAAPAPAPAKAAPEETPASHAAVSKAIQEINEARNKVHQKLIQAMDLRRLDVSRMAEQELRDTTKAMIDEIIANDKTFPANLDKARIGKLVLDEVVGLGPLEDLLADPTVTEIMVNRYDQIYVERKGKLTLSEITFSGEKAVVGAIERIVAPLGRRIDESSPMVDARLKDGSRVNAVIPPLALKGANITIRKFSKEKLKDKDLIKFGSITAEMMGFMEQAVLHACNIVISGGTGSGKTTLLNVLSNYIPDDERIITVEDAAELQLSQPHIISLESRPPNSEGKGAVHIRDLVKNCLRMRPDRIVVGECRGGEALDMLQAMNTGHDGSLTTAHANTPRDCLARLEVMTLMSGLDLPIRAIREQIASAVHVIIQQSRFPDGSRKVTHISEITGMEGEVIQMQDIFLFKQDGYDENGKIKGKFVATGNIPELYQELQQRGISVDLSLFKPEGRH
ncbi:MAG: Flp pilus assembly complex ATPase component TadA [Burkholderiales bacterium]|jgi:pilus assembly protein CpaF|nr:Flp pilus assembly complex ATPase component TadA [Burkholderiales bacterium]